MKIITKLTILLCMSGFIFVCLFVRGNSNTRIIAGREYEYEHYSRKLSIDDFRHFGYDTMYQEVVDAIGKENGDIGNNFLLRKMKKRRKNYPVLNSMR